MKLDNCYDFEYSDYLHHFNCYPHNILANMSFGLLQVYHVELGSSHTESRTEPFIWTTWVDCSDCVKHVVRIKGSVRDSVRAPELDMKHLKNAEWQISRKFVSIKITMRSKVRIFYVIIFSWNKAWLLQFWQKPASDLTLRNNEHNVGWGRLANNGYLICYGGSQARQPNCSSNNLWWYRL